MSKTKDEPTAEEQLGEIRAALFRRVPGQHGKFVDKKNEFRSENTVDLVRRLVEPPQTNEDADQRIKDAILDRVKAGNKEAVKALKRLMNLRLDCPFPLEKGVYGEDPQKDRLSSAPLFSEAYLYALFGKEDARTILAVLRRVYEALGATSFEMHLDEGEDEED